MSTPIFSDMEADKTFCILDAPTREAIEKHHDKIAFSDNLKSNYSRTIVDTISISSRITPINTVEELV